MIKKVLLILLWLLVPFIPAPNPIDREVEDER